MEHVGHQSGRFLNFHQNVGIILYRIWPLTPFLHSYAVLHVLGPNGNHTVPQLRFTVVMPTADRHFAEASICPGRVGLRRALLSGQQPHKNVQFFYARMTSRRDQIAKT
ncbi:unnamed protein product [Protopolystoma xenopodis]|uniref:Uncharacterized protein n=1 Tax=Protopolystoma xenopodis TaxID=117903 RepID=A0A448WQH2_9PLAT|nr:unnamed protein product [Protopolystoma xenopodis]